MRSLAASVVALLLLASTSQVAAQPASRAAGSWIGTLQVGPAQLRIVFNITTDSSGALSATLDSPDQGATGIPVSSVLLTGDSLKLGVLAVSGGFVGRMEAGDTAITGTWMQGGMSLPPSQADDEATRNLEATDARASLSIPGGGCVI